MKLCPRCDTGGQVLLTGEYQAMSPSDPHEVWQGR